jgi:hypothetical protein
MSLGSSNGHVRLYGALLVAERRSLVVCRQARQVQFVVRPVELLPCWGPAVYSSDLNISEKKDISCDLDEYGVCLAIL